MAGRSTTSWYKEKEKDSDMNIYPMTKPTTQKDRQDIGLPIGAIRLTIRLVEGSFLLDYNNNDQDQNFWAYIGSITSSALTTSIQWSLIQESHNQ